MLPLHCSLIDQPQLIQDTWLGLDEVRTGCYRTLWNPANLVNQKEDAASNYGRGYYTSGKTFLPTILERVTQEIERCDNLSAFEIVHAYAGGTGSGFSALLTEKLTELFGKKFKFSLGVFPSPRFSEIMVETYNCVLHTHCSLVNEDCVIIFDNESLFHKSVHQLHVCCPTFTLMNRLIAQMFSSVSLSHRYRFSGSQHADVTELLTNLVPYPRIHFPVMSYAPLISHEQMGHELYGPARLTNDVFQPHSQALHCSSAAGKYMSCCMLYRGAFVSPKPIVDAIAKIKNSRDINFVDWCPTGFKIGLNTCPPLQVPSCEQAIGESALCMLSGNTAVIESWSLVGHKFDMLMAKRAFVHWYVTEGLEEGEFLEARENVQSLIMDYEELASQDVAMADEMDMNSPLPPPSPQLSQHNSSNNKTSLNYQSERQRRQQQDNLLANKYTQLYFADDDLDPQLDLSHSHRDEERSEEPLSKLEKMFGKNRSAVTNSDFTRTDKVIPKSNYRVRNIVDKCHRAIDNVHKFVDHDKPDTKSKAPKIPKARKDIKKTVEKYLSTTANRPVRNLTYSRKPGFNKSTILPRKRSTDSMKRAPEKVTISERSESSEITNASKNSYLEKYEIMKNNNKDFTISTSTSSNAYKTALETKKSLKFTSPRLSPNRSKNVSETKQINKDNDTNRLLSSSLLADNANTKPTQNSTDSTTANLIITNEPKSITDIVADSHESSNSNETLKNSISGNDDESKPRRKLTFRRKHLEVSSMETVICEPVVQ